MPKTFRADKAWPGSRTNSERADMAYRALVEYGVEGEQETAMADLLADLLHLCDLNEWDFEQAMARARKYHAEER